MPRQPSSHPVSRPPSTQGHLEEQNVFADRRGRNTAIQSPVTSNNFCANNPVLEECDGPPSEGWSTVTRGQSNMRTSRANHQKVCNFYENFKCFVQVFLILIELCMVSYFKSPLEVTLQAQSSLIIRKSLIQLKHGFVPVS